MGTSALGPLVTVLVTAFDPGAGLDATIASVRAQSHREFEIIVVSDRSSEGLAGLTENAGAEVRAVIKSCAGLAGAGNAGLDAARGSVVALLRAGDLWEPTLLERCVGVLIDEPRVGIVTTEVRPLDDAAEPSSLRFGPTVARDFPAREHQLDAIADHDFLTGPVIFDRRLLDLVGGGFDPAAATATRHDLWIRCLLAGSAAGIVAEDLARCRGPETVEDDDRLAALERHLPSLWLRGAHGRPQDAYAIARRVAARGERRLAIWFVAHALIDDGASPLARIRYAFGGAWAVLTAPRPHRPATEGAA